MDILWNVTSLPSDLKEVVKNLSVSQKYADKFLSVLATFSILKSTYMAVESMNQLQYLEVHLIILKIINKTDKQFLFFIRVFNIHFFLFQLINFMNGPKVIPQCCFPMRNRLAELINNFLKAFSKGVKNIEIFFKETDVCKQKPIKSS